MAGSREALRLTPLREYAHLVIGVNNLDLPLPFRLASFRRYIGWAWIPAEGAASFSSVAGRPPSPRDRSTVREEGGGGCGGRVFPCEEGGGSHWGAGRTAPGATD